MPIMSSIVVPVVIAAPFASVIPLVSIIPVMLVLSTVISVPWRISYHHLATIITPVTAILPAVIITTHIRCVVIDHHFITAVQVKGAIIGG